MKVTDEHYQTENQDCRDGSGREQYQIKYEYTWGFSYKDDLNKLVFDKDTGKTQEQKLIGQPFPMHLTETEKRDLKAIDQMKSRRRNDDGGQKKGTLDFCCMPAANLGKQERGLDSDRLWMTLSNCVRTGRNI